MEKSSEIVLPQESTHPVLEAPVSPKKKLDFKIPTIFLIAILLIAGGVYAGIQIGKKQKTPSEIISKQSSPTVPVAEPTLDETADWETYRYQEIFEIKVPRDFKVIDRGYGSVEIGDYLSIGLGPDPKDCRGDCPIIETIEPRILNGLEAKYITGWWGDIGGKIAQSYIKYLIPFNGKFVGLSMQELPFSTPFTFSRDKVGKVSEENLKLLDQIFSTFKFTNGNITDETTNWKTYRNEEYRFEFKYPENMVSDFQKEPYNGFCNDNKRAGLVNLLLFPLGTELPVHRELEINDVSFFVYSEENSSSVSVDTWIEKNCPQILSEFKTENIEIAGQPVLKFTRIGEGMGAGEIQPYFFFSANNKMFYIHPYGNKDIFDQILSTFKFLD